MTGKKNVSEFVQLTRPHQRQLYGIAIALCRDADQAADLVQETLVRGFEAFDQFREGSPILPWLRRILRNLFLDSFKTGRARHEITEREFTRDDGELLLEPPDTSDDPLAQLERARLGSWLKEEMAQLQPEHQQVLTLCVMGEMEFQEAAEIMGIPVGTVASRLARARAKLRERMQKRALAGGAEASAAATDESLATSRTGSGRAEEPPPDADDDEERPGQAKEAAP